MFDLKRERRSNERWRWGSEMEEMVLVPVHVFTSNKDEICIEK